MSKVTINRFAYGGLAKNSRTPSTNKAGYVQNFDILNYPETLKPYRGMTENETKAYFINDFQYINGGVGIGDNILGFGVQSGQGISGRAELYIKSGDLLTGGWTTAITSSGTATKQRGTNSMLFFLYQGYVYYACGGTHIARIGDLESSGVGATLNETYYALSYNTFVTQAIRHSKDGIMYFGADNILYYKNGTSSIATALTLPADLVITSVEEVGNYVMISVRPKNNIGESSSFLWGRDTSITLPDESIQWGRGVLKIIGKVDGVPIGISFIGNSIFNINPKIVIKKYEGGQPQIVCELIGENTSITLYDKKWQTDNRLYFGAKITLNGESRHTIFCVGKNDNGEIIVHPDINIDNDTAITIINGFAKFDDIWFVAHNNDGSINQTLNDGSYAGTSIWESLKNPSMDIEDRHLLKKLINVSVSFSKLPSNGQVVLKYRLDGATSWDTIKTETTDNGVYFKTTNLSDGQQFKQGREIEFRIESTGGAEITEFSYEYLKIN